MAFDATQALPAAGRGSIQCKMDSTTYLLPAGPDNSILTASANAADGTGLAWSSSPILQYLQINQNLTVNEDVQANFLGSTTGMGLFGSTVVSQPAYPGTGVDNNADTINAIVAILVSYGLCASFPTIKASLSGGATTGAASTQIATPFTVTLSLAAPAGGVVVTPTGTLSGDTFQAASGGDTVSTVTVSEGGTTVNFYLTPGADGTDHVSFTTAPVTTYAGTPKTVTVTG